MRKTTPNTCPICGRKYRTAKCICRKSGSELGGHSTCSFCSFSDRDPLFALPLIKRLGSMNLL